MADKEPPMPLPHAATTAAVVVDITSFVLDCAENHLTMQDPFLSHPMKEDDDEHDDDEEPHVEVAAASSVVPQEHDAVLSTAAATAAVSSLAVPISSDFFSLHEAMAASQLMDRKMDCCEIPADLVAPWKRQNAASKSDHDDPDRMVYPRPIPTALNDPMTPLPWHDLTIPSAASIAVEMLVRLQSFLSGSSVGESTFTCLYAHEAVLKDMKMRLVDSVHSSTTVAASRDSADADTNTSLESQMLDMRLENQSSHRLCPNDDDTTVAAQWCILASSLALVELTDSIRTIVMNANIYEEEDFVSNTHNLPFYILRNPSKMDRKDDSTERSESANQTALPPTAAADKGSDLTTVDIIAMALQRLDSIFPTSAKSGIDNFATILRLVLGYQSDLLFVCSTMARLSENVRDTVVAAQTTVRRAVERLVELESIVSVTLQSENDGTDSGDDRNIYSADVELVLQRCFDSYVNRVLVGNLPVRKISFLPPTDALAVLRTIASEVDTTVCQFLLHNGSTLGRIQHQLDRVVSGFGTNILSRSLLLLNLYFGEKLLGQYDLRQLLTDHMVQWQGTNNYPSSSLTSNETRALNLLESDENAAAFVHRLAKPIYDTLKLKLLNRNRQRAYIDMVMLPEWTLLQNEANLADFHCSTSLATVAAADAAATTSTKNNGVAHDSNENNAATAPCSTYFTRYVLSILLRLMDRYVEAGLEVGLFVNHYDLAFAYWYRDFLLSALNQNLTVMRRNVEVEALTAATTTRAAVSANSNASPGASAPSHNATASSSSSHGKQHRGKKKHKNKAAVTTTATVESNGRLHPGTSHDIGTAAAAPTANVPSLLVHVEDELELKVIAVKRNMCRKTIQFLAALKQVGILKERQGLFEFTSLQRIFDHRFQVFGGIRQPPPLSFDDFQQGNDFSAVPSAELLQSVTEGFTYCRSFLEHILDDMQQHAMLDRHSTYAPITDVEVRALLKVCLGNVIYVQKLNQIIGSGNDDVTQAKAVFDFGSHHSFCIVKVTL